MRILRCSLRLIEALTVNEAWGRIWSGLLTCGITPVTEGSRLSWSQRSSTGSEAHFDIALLPTGACRTP